MIYFIAKLRVEVWDRFVGRSTVRYEISFKGSFIIRVRIGG